jgi:L-ascorbate metabolism protein UlaG (beta-lactamase superfamily)
MIVFVLLVILFAAIVVLFMRQQQFGKTPSGARMERIKQSPNYRNGAFQNLNNTPALAEGVGYTTVMRDFFFRKSKRSSPASKIPAIKTDLISLDRNEDILVWFGHSSYFLQTGGVRFLIDPVFSGNASPVSFTTRSFDGADRYTPDDMPEVDYLLITHDHYDHLDHRTVQALRPKVKKVITGLGVGAHLEHWGYDSQVIHEMDWNESFSLRPGFTIHTVPARHFSGRRFKRNGTLWTSFVLTAPGRQIFIGGDSGYDSHFAAIGDKFGPFDLVMLENGQYNEYWKYIHMMPEQVVQAAKDLKARKLFPVHWSKFALALHDWDEPIKRVVTSATNAGMPLLHPRIGEVTHLNETTEPSKWWDTVL